MQSSKDIEQYTHLDKTRANNPPVGLVTAETDKDKEKKKYEYDPHLDPQLQWAGKTERTSFEIPTVSLHVHERIDPKSIIQQVKKRPKDPGEYQQGLFDTPENNPALREAIEFYKHQQGWTNRLITGDSLLVMNSLLEKEGMGGKVQMVYIDPPYGIKYGSNFQPFIDKRNVTDGKDEDLTAEPEMIKAFRDTWELGLHSYLTYMRDRLLLTHKLLADTGCVFIQISDENVHHLREILDEIFGANNFISEIVFRKTGGFSASYIDGVYDLILCYAKDKPSFKYRQLFQFKELSPDGLANYQYIELEKDKYRSLTNEEKNNLKDIDITKVFGIHTLESSGSAKEPQPFKFNNKVFEPKSGNHWKASYPDGLDLLASQGRIIDTGNRIGYKRYYKDNPLLPLNNLWTDTRGEMDINYVVQTSTKVIQRCLLMSTDPGDIVLDITSGSGTTAYVAEQYGRRWIAVDTSRVANTLAKQRLMTSVFDYYDLAEPEKGISAGFKYKTVPHIMLSDIANNRPSKEEILNDQPIIDSSKIRVTGPFTAEAVPSPVAKSFDEIESTPEADQSITRSGETLRQDDWRSELLQTGVRGKGGQYLKFSRIEPKLGTRYIQAEGETLPIDGQSSKRVFIVFGPEYAPLEQRQVQLALDETQNLRPKPDILFFVAFQFDSEAAKDIDETDWPGITLLRAQMNADLFTEDLKKKRTSNDSFWLVGQPDVELHKKGKQYQIEVKGFDYYDPKSGTVTSGVSKNIAMWMLDTDYDGRSLYPNQVFFPMSGNNDGWSKLAKNLKANINDELIESYRGTVSLKFEAGEYKRVAVKIIDDRGIESLRILNLD